MTPNTNDNQTLSDRMLSALEGNFERRTEEVSGRYFAAEDQGKRQGVNGITYWDTLFCVEDGRLKTINAFPHWEKKAQDMLEAFVLIPEQAGLAKVDRVINGYFENRGFLHPEYKNEAIEAIYDSASRYFEVAGTLQPNTRLDNTRLIRAVMDLTPGERTRFAKFHRERMLNGIRNTQFNSEYEEETLWANLTYTLQKAGFTSKDDDFVRAVWEKSKTIPCGYLYPDYGAQQILASALVERDANGLMKFDYIRQNIPYANLSQILLTIPVREDVELTGWRASEQYPGREIYVPIVRFIDKTLGGAQ
jgi:hypothetical protein